MFRRVDRGLGPLCQPSIATVSVVATLPPQPRAPYEDPGVLDSDARWYAGDFIMLSEHNTNSGLTLYASVQPDYPKLLLIPGVEWTTYAGHANAIGATEWVDHKVGVRGVTTVGAIQQYHDQGSLFSINHPTVPWWIRRRSTAIPSHTR